MSIQAINRALESFQSRNANYVELVHDLVEIGCSDALIQAVLVGAAGDSIKTRIAPITAILRGYESLSAAEQIDVLYSVVNRQEAATRNENTSKIKIA
jgi:hypothetical protein